MFYVLGTQKIRLIAQPLSYLMLSALEKFQNVLEFISIFVELTSSKSKTNVLELKLNHFLEVSVN